MNSHPYCGRLTACALLALVSASCGDGDALLFPAASEVQIDWSGPGASVVGTLIDEPIELRVLDHRGNPVPAVPVTIEVVAGAGTIGAATKRSGDDGRVLIRSWRMGETVGTNRLRLSAPGIEPLDLEVETNPGSPRELEVADPLPYAPQVATTVTDLTPVRVVDRFGNPVPGATVRFTPSADGSVEAAEVTTDAEGLAHQPGWTLDTRAGPQFLRATIPNVTSIQLDIEASAGPPVAVHRIAPDGQRVEVGLHPPHPPGLEILDEWGNGVPGVPAQFALLAGGGTISEADDVSDSTGRVRAHRWHLGPAPGLNRISIEVPGFPPEDFTAEGVPEGSEPEGRYFRVRAAHVNQGNQDFHGSIPLIEGRPGLLRVFVEASEPDVPAPLVEVVLSRHGEELRRERLEMRTVIQLTTAPVSVPSSGTGPSWDLVLDPAWITPGLQLEVVVDPDHDIGVFTRRWTRFPESAAPFELPFATPQPFRVRFVPLRDSGTGVEGNITQATLPEFMEMTRRILPIGEDQVHLGAAFVTNLIGADGRIQSRLSHMRQHWLGSQFRDHYFHGIYPSSVPRDFSGIAYRPSNPASPAPIAMTVDLLPQASFTVAHEFGHNLGIRHAPCGNPAGPDANYPYSNANLGTVGYDRSTGNLIDPTGNRDLMSYCGPRWISDYNFDLMLQWRMASPLGVPAAVPGQTGSSGPGLLVAGQVNSSGIVLEPAYSIDAPPFMPGTGGSFTLRGLDATGATVFSFAFEPDEIPHASDPAERHFGFVIPMDAATRNRLARIEVDAPAGTSQQWSRVLESPAGVAGAPSALQLPDPGDPRMTLTFDRNLFPRAIVYDVASGELVGILDGGEVPLALWDEPIRVLLSDGLHSWEVATDGTLERR